MPHAVLHVVALAQMKPPKHTPSPGQPPPVPPVPVELLAELGPPVALELLAELEPPVALELLAELEPPVALELLVAPPPAPLPVHLHAPRLCPLESHTCAPWAPLVQVQADDSPGVQLLVWAPELQAVTSVGTAAKSTAAASRTRIP